MPGTGTSTVEVVNVSSRGFWILHDERERFLSFDDFPWFREAPIRAVLNVVLSGPARLRWPDLDIDLALDSIDRPEKYPLIARDSGARFSGSRLSFEFLERFSLFECALKRAGYCAPAGAGVRVRWRKFAREKQDGVEWTGGFEAAIQPLLEHPPHKQTCTDGVLDWERQETRSLEAVDLEWLLQMTYTVRNNLFHGGKWPQDPSRDPELLRAGIAVIDLCLHIDRNVENAYHLCVGE